MSADNNSLEAKLREIEEKVSNLRKDLDRERQENQIKTVALEQTK